MNDTVDQQVQRLARQATLDGDDDPFMVVDVEEVMGKLAAWREHLPRVEPMYAVKCHDDDRILKAMIEAGMGFDCASKGEIRKVMELGVVPERIVYANPCKAISHLKFAKTKNVRLMTFDNHDELFKIKQVYPDAELLLRLLPDDSEATCRLGQKFGADLAAVPSLLELAQKLDLRVVGMAFHVGSGCPRISSFSDAVLLARQAFDVAEGMGMNLRVLDIGGGFPGDAVSTWKGQGELDLNFPNIAAVLRKTIDTLFPVESGIRLIAEPGRYFVHSCSVLVTNVIAKRAPQPGEDRIRYYVNEGVYANFNNLLYDHAHVGVLTINEYQGEVEDENCRFNLPEEEDRSLTPTPLDSDSSGSDGESQHSGDSLASVWGPTCDGLDCILPKVKLPTLSVGDWLVFPNMGAYTYTGASTFNGFELTKKVYMERRK